MQSKNRLVQVILVSAIALLILLLPFFNTPALAAKDRLFLDFSLEFLGKYELPTANVVPIGELSAITYDRRRDRFYAVSGNKVYTLKLELATTSDGIKIQKIEIESVILLADRDGKNYELADILSKGIALTPQQTVYISGSQIDSDRLIPFVGEFELKTGRMLQSLSLPERYISDACRQEQTKGIQDDSPLASLTFNATGTVPTTGEPINLFTATETALVQDRAPNLEKIKSRLLHYLIGFGSPMLLAEYAYPLEQSTSTLEELLSVVGVHFLSLERDRQQAKYTGKIYQIVTSGATDTSKIASLKGEIRGVRAIKKKLVLDLQKLGITLGNLSEMTFGSRLPDGTKSLLIVDNFESEQTARFLLFRFHD